MSGRRNLMIAISRGYDPDESAWLVVTTTENKAYQFYLLDSNTTRLHTVDWGDGTKEAVSTGTTAFKAFQHIYIMPGEYEIRVRGKYYGIDLTGFSSTNAIVNEWFHVSNGVTVMNNWCGYGKIRAIGTKFSLPPNLVNMNSFARYGSLPADAASKLQFPDSVNNLSVAFENLGGSDFDVTHIFDKWVTKSRSRSVRQAFALYNRNVIVGTAPDLWNQGFTFSDTRSAFGNCTRLTNYNEIPASWGGGGA